MEEHKTQRQDPTQENEERAAQERKKKKIIKGVLIFCAVVIVLSALSTMIDPQSLVDSMFGKKPQKQQDKVIYFYPEDDEFNRLDNEDYLEMDNRMHYHNPFEGTTYSIEEDMVAQESEEVVFFYNYFKRAIAGEGTALREMYASSFDNIEYKPVALSVQMIYNIEVTPQTDGGNIVAYRVDYAIHRNNGLLREDVGSDEIRPLLFSLTRENGQLKIASIVPYYAN